MLYKKIAIAFLMAVPAVVPTDVCENTKALFQSYACCDGKGDAVCKAPDLDLDLLEKQASDKTQVNLKFAQTSTIVRSHPDELWDPRVASYTDQTAFLSNTMGRLVKQNAERTAIEGDLAESWTEETDNQNNTVVTFKLRDNNYFTSIVNGLLVKKDKITAHSVKKAFELLFMPTSTSYYPTYVVAPMIPNAQQRMQDGTTALTGFTVVDDLTIKVELIGKPIAYLEKLVFTYIFNENVKTEFSGSYIPESLDKNIERFVKNPYNFRYTIPDTPDSVERHRIIANDLITDVFALGGYDATTSCSGGALMSSKHPELQKHVKLITTGLSVVMYFNVKAFDRLPSGSELRKAIAYAFPYGDQKTIVEDRKDQWTSIDQYSPEGYNNRPLTGAAQDLTKANQHLNAYMTANGITDKSKITVNVCNRNNNQERGVLELQPWADAVNTALGINVQLKTPTPVDGLDFLTSGACLAAEDQHVVFAGWLPDYPNAYNYVGDMALYFASWALKSDSTDEYGLDALPAAYTNALETFKGATTDEERTAALTTAQNTLVSEGILLPWFTGSNRVLQLPYITATEACGCDAMEYQDQFKGLGHDVVRHIKNNLNNN